jgi:hypothetical protein
MAFVQEPTTAESPTMPSAAIRCVPGARVQPIAQIAAALASLATVDAVGRSARPDHSLENHRRVAPPGSA